MDQAGFTVDYIEDIDDNNTFYGKIKDQLKLGQFTGYDTVTFTDWMNGRLINDKQVQEFDYANLPNVETNLVDAQWDALDVDQGRKFTIPWQLPHPAGSGTRRRCRKEFKTLEDFLRPELKGKVVVLSEMRDTMGMVMAGLGTDPNSDWGDTEFDAALAWLDDALKSGQIGNVKGNSYTQDLITGDALAAMAWTGDVVNVLNAENDNQWTLEIPESGGMIAADSFTVPNGTSAAAKAQVEELINYYYDPVVMAEVANYVTFVPPVRGRRRKCARSTRKRGQPTHLSGRQGLGTPPQLPYAHCRRGQEVLDGLPECVGTVNMAAHGAFAESGADLELVGIQKRFPAVLPPLSTWTSRFRPGRFSPSSARRAVARRQPCGSSRA